MRSHLYRAAEALRNSVAPKDFQADRAKRWEAFRQSLDIPRTHVVLSAHQLERHAEYAEARPMSSEEVDALLDGIADLLGRYIAWFKAAKLASYGG